MKKLLKLLTAVLLVATLVACSKTSEKESSSEKHESLVGVVKEVTDESLLIEPDENAKEGRAELSVSRKTEDESGKREFKVGDKVTAEYDGKITLSDPGQINHVYSIEVEREK